MTLRGRQHHLPLKDFFKIKTLKDRSEKLEIQCVSFSLTEIRNYPHDESHKAQELETIESSCDAQWEFWEGRLVRDTNHPIKLNRHGTLKR